MGCSSKADKMAETCAKFEEIAQLTDDCDKMAQRFDHARHRFARQIQDVKRHPPKGEEAERTIAAMQRCVQATLEIAAGPCGANQNIQKTAQEEI